MRSDQKGMEIIIELDEAMLKIAWRRKVEVFVCEGGCDATPRCSHEKSNLKEKGLYNLLDRFIFLIGGSGECSEPHRPAVEFCHDRFENMTIHEVQSLIIHIQHL